MKTCFVVHDPNVARALQSHLGPDARVATPGSALNGFAIDRLIVVDAPDLDPEDAPRYAAWMREVVATRLTAGAVLVNVPRWALC